MSENNNKTVSENELESLRKQHQIELAQLEKAHQMKIAALTEKKEIPLPDQRQLPILDNFCKYVDKVGNHDKILNVVYQFMKGYLNTYGARWGPEHIVNTAGSKYMATIDNSRAVMDFFLGLSGLNAFVNGGALSEPNPVIRTLNILDNISYICFSISEQVYYLSYWAPEVGRRFKVDLNKWGFRLGLSWLIMVVLELLRHALTARKLLKQRERLLRSPGSKNNDEVRGVDLQLYQLLLSKVTVAIINTLQSARLCGLDLLGSAGRSGWLGLLAAIISLHRTFPK